MLRKKKSVVILVLVLLVSTIVGCTQQESSSKGEEFVIGLDDTFAPMSFRNEQNEIVGFDVDLAKEVAKRNGWNIRFQPIDWAMKEAELNSGNIDMIWNGYTITDERKEKVNFTDAYLTNSQIIVTLSDSDIDEIDDLKNKTVATQAESSSLDAARKLDGFIESLKDGKIIEYSTFNEVFNDLESGRTDAIIVDEVLARYYMNNKGEGLYKVLDENLGIEEYGVGVRKEDEELLKKLNITLEEMKNDGTYDEIYSMWFAE
ncbi:amino acid ABC transporter substrate-binding protein [Soehngenia longivitae]|uniref:Amino acid ABC transporter substrate-binding protein n=1 Tax=Soehngenia longivitae TaxID=2562294 RepID=A0A4Z0D9Z7_9FIRM|nr:amino acid ABC transporter substrate-binding protein [Soehngenia longivitae]TFZ41685.1 amino acid ABC transporter substrate-binding protein [Soehngenia longivitae]